MNDFFIRGVKIATEDLAGYPFSIPAIRDAETISFTSPVTFFVGENGTGKSTLIEAIAVAAGFNAEGGTKNYNFSSYDTISPLAQSLTLVRGPRREKRGYFLRAESFYTTANYAEKGTFPTDGSPAPLLVDGKRLHEQSHGEAFMSIIHEFEPGLFILDEPESALSPRTIITLIQIIQKLTDRSAQFIIATHSPILLAVSGAKIYQFSQRGLWTIAYEDVDHVKITREFLHNPEKYIGT